MNVTTNLIPTNSNSQYMNVTTNSRSQYMNQEILGVGLKRVSLTILCMLNFWMILKMRLCVVVDGGGVVIWW